MRALAICIILGQVMLAAAQSQPSSSNTQSAYCTFDDQTQISVQYNASPSAPKDEPRNGKVWLPAGAPMTLFTQAEIMLNNATIPVGAYSMYVIPGKNNWTLIVNKNVSSPSNYDEKQDVARGPMELGEVSSPPKELQVSFAHVAPKQCSIRLYYGKVGAFSDFVEK